MRLRWSRHALRHLDEIGTFISRDSPGAAQQWITRLRERARKAARVPRAGRIVPEVQQEDVREVFLGNYRVLYLVRGDAIRVLSVLEGHRELRTEDVQSEE